MNYLLNHYNSVIEENNEFEAFRKFYSGNIKPIEEWYRNQCGKISYAKSTAKSQNLRKNGNNFYKKGSWEKCLKYYTKALNFAEWDSKQYALALANRSAALYSLGDYKNCMRDIDQCISSKYPQELAYKIYLRKAECCNKLGNLTDEILKNVERIISESDIVPTEKESHLAKLKNMTVSTIMPEKNSEDFVNNSCKFKENPNFAYASCAVILCYDKNNGRIVKAKQKILQGETLFIEKAFLFAPVFDDTGHIIPNKCFNCMTNTTITIPCKTCSMCQYCSETCRDTSWTEFHKWECKGMTYNLFYDLGIAYPALRSLIKGIPSKFSEAVDPTNVDNFGSKDDNYPYFNSLVTNLSASQHYIHFLIMSTLLILYLRKETDFLNHLKAVFGLESDVEVIIKCGGLLVRHMAQLSCNSSIVDHWNCTPDKIPMQSTIVACGIFPSISMMNHSCKTNVTLTYDKDVAIVKALRDIEPNEEIHNSYGVDYRFMTLSARKEHLARLYNFICCCEICSNPLSEFELADTYLCPNCQGPLGVIVGNCHACKKYFKLENFKQTDAEVDALLDKPNITKADIDKCYDLCTTIFSRNHIKIAECLDLYVNFFKTEGNYVEMLSYFKKSLEVKDARYGCNSRNLVMHRIDVLKEIIDKLKVKEMSEGERGLLEEVKTMYREAFDALKLYFTDDIINLCSADETTNK